MAGESCYPTPAISTALCSGHPPTLTGITAGASPASAASTHWNTLPLTESELRSKKAFAYGDTLSVQWPLCNLITAEKAKTIAPCLPLGLAVLWTQQPFQCPLCRRWDTNSTRIPPAASHQAAEFTQLRTVRTSWNTFLILGPLHKASHVALLLQEMTEISTFEGSPSPSQLRACPLLSFDDAWSFLPDQTTLSSLSWTADKIYAAFSLQQMFIGVFYSSWLQWRTPDAILHIVIKHRVWIIPSYKTPSGTRYPCFWILSFRIHFPSRDTACRTHSVVRTEYWGLSVNKFLPLCLAETSEPAGLLPRSVSLSRLDNKNLAGK